MRSYPCPVCLYLYLWLWLWLQLVSAQSFSCCSIHHNSYNNSSSNNNSYSNSDPNSYWNSNRDRDGVMDVVDVMTVISDPHEFEYLRNGDVWLSLLLMLKYSPPQHVRVHIMTNNVKVLSIGKELGLHMYWMQDYQRHHDQFMALYRPNHHSINTVEYEFLCYYRWHLYKYILDSWNQRLGINNTNTTYSTTSSTTNSSINSDTNRHLLGVDSYDQEGFESVEDDRPIKKIITMDSDIVFLMDPLVFYNKVIASLDQPGLRMDSKPSDSYNSTDSSITSDNSCSNGNNTEYDLVVVTSGALHLWTAKGIQDYSQYIFDWYSQDPEVVTAKTKTFAGYLYKRLHVSDMQLIEKYVRENPCTRNGCYINSAKGYWTRSVDHQCLFSRLGCVPMSRYDDMMNNNSFKIISSQVYGRDEQFPYCLMHFQGENAKVLIKVLSKYLLPLASNGLHETINVTYIPTRGIARQTPLYSGEFLGQLANESRSVWTSPSPHPHHHKANKHGHDTTKSHSVGHTQNRKYLRVAKFFNVTKHQSTAKTYEDLVSLSKKFDHQILNDLVFSPLAIRPKLDRQIYLVHKGYAYGVPNIDVFTENLKLTFNHVVHNVPSEFFNMIPFGVEPNTTTPR